MACQRCSTCGIGWPLGTSGCAQCGGATWYNVSGEVTQAEGKAPTKTAPRKDAIECGACKWEVTGYSKTELVKQGWAWHAYEGCVAGQEFVCCAECEEEYAERRLQRAKGAAA